MINLGSVGLLVGKVRVSSWLMGSIIRLYCPSCRGFILTGGNSFVLAKNTGVWLKYRVNIPSILKFFFFGCSLMIIAVSIFFWGYFLLFIGPEVEMFYIVVVMIL